MFVPKIFLATPERTELSQAVVSDLVLHMPAMHLNSLGRAKFKFTVTFGKLELSCNDKWHPDKVAISLIHRRRRYVCKPRTPEPSFFTPSRFSVVWQDLASDFLEVITTLYRDARKEQFDNKEWTMVVEELNSKGRYRPLAGISLNLRHFVNELSGTKKTELKLKLRPLRKEIRLCKMQICLSSILLNDKDVQNIASIASQEVVNRTLEHEIESLESRQPDYGKVALEPYSTHYHKDQYQNVISSINNDIETCLEESKNEEELSDFGLSEQLRPKPRTMLTNKFAEIKLRDEKDAVASPANSENRISTMSDFGLSEQEEKVMRELEQLRKQREDADAIDFRHVPEQVEGGDIKYEVVVPYVKEEGSRSGSKLTTPEKQLLQPFDSDSHEEQQQSETTTKTQTDVEVEARILNKFLDESPLVHAGSRPTQLLVNGSSTEGNLPSAVGLNATPTRKIVSKIESDIKNTDKLAEELQKLSDRMEEIDRLDSYIRQKLSEVEPGSEDEQKFIEEKMKLTQEKDALVRKQDYFNVIGTLNETTEKIAIVQQKLAHFAMNDDYKTEEEKQMIDSLMRELKELVDQKNNLTVELMAKEEEEEEYDERSRLTLERIKTSYVANKSCRDE
uniref:C2 NT-type domain-containing protein n=1 Tax=Acrobeloides nanus TaxID=290746 RepID=A0A914CM68_9BILA